MAGSVPEDLRYTRDHEWVRQNDATVEVGITDFAQKQLGDVVFVELPNVGDRFEATDSLGTIESVKTVSELYSPVTGEVVEINEELTGSPENVNVAPYREGWLVKIRMADANQVTDLLTPAEYDEYLNNQGG